MKDPCNGKIYKIICDETGEVYFGSTTLPTEDERLKVHEANYSSFLKGNYPFLPIFNIIERGNYHIELVKDFPCETIFDLEREEGNIILANPCININVPGRTDEEKKIKKAETDKAYREGPKREEILKKKREDSKTDAAKERRRLYRVNYPEKVKAQKAADYQKHKEKRAATSAIWTANNRERKKETDKAGYERRKDPKINERKEWIKNHPEEVAAEKEKKAKEKNKNSYLKDKENGKCETIECECGGKYIIRNLARHLKTKKHQDLYPKIYLKNEFI